MKVIVFGGAGFLGSHVVDELKERGHEVTVFDLVNGQDIKNFGSIEAAIKGQEIVYNFAGLADLTASRHAPITTMELNVIGNLNVLIGAKLAKVKRYIYASTVYVFSKKGSFYGISKQAAERCVEEMGVPFTILRYGSVYGPRSDEKNRIYRIIRQALTDGIVTHEGSGLEEREYIHVKDAARLSVDILDSQYKNKHIMLTGNERYTYESILRMLAEMFGIRFAITRCVYPGHYGLTPYSYQPNQSLKLMANPYIDLGQGLLETIEDIRARLDR